MERVDPRKAAREIVAVLHKNKIPLGFIPTVFEEVIKDVEAHTVPYGGSSGQNDFLIREPETHWTDMVKSMHPRNFRISDWDMEDWVNVIMWVGLGVALTAIPVVIHTISFTSK